MRVMAGKARKLFHILNPYLTNADFLDFFSGNGAIGIEALSRGAKYAAFVENNQDAIDCIKSNLADTKLEEQGEIYPLNPLDAIRALELRGKVFDVIFINPPYNQLYEKEILLALQYSSIIYCDTIIVVEASLQTKFDYLERSKFKILKKKEYKTNQHVYIEFK